MTRIKNAYSLFLTLVFLLSGLVAVAQSMPPVEGTMRLSGTFGELRGDHYHTGIDIKSPNGRVGTPIYAVDDGYISRLLVRSGGYGNAILIRHLKQNRTSLYGHLLHFTPRLDSMVNAKQFQEEQFEVTIDLDPEELPVKQGEQVATLGSTGYSFGPHLHFEWIATASGSMINPLLLGWKVADKSAPIIEGIRIDHLDYKYRTYHHTDIEALLTDSVQDTIEVDAWRCGFGIETIDFFNGKVNRNGIYSILLKLDGDTIYYHRFDSLSTYDLQRHTTYTDFKALSLEKRHIYRCHAVQSSRNNDLNGVIPLYRDKVQKVEILIRDFSGNLSSREVWLKRTDTVESPAFAGFDYEIPYDKDHEIHIDGFSACISTETFYEDTYCHIQRHDQAGKISDEFEISPYWTALQKRISIRFKRPHTVREGKEKVYISQRIGDKEYSIGGKWKEDHIEAQTGSLGLFSLKIDTTPPIIESISQQRIGNEYEIVVQADDDLQYRGVRSFTYRVSIDNKWWLGIYDAKSKRITVKIPNTVGPGKHTAAFRVEDHVGNVTEKSFVFSFP